MRKYITLVGVALLLTLVGCASPEITPEQQIQMMELQAAVASQPTFKVVCPLGCTAQYTDPRDRQKLVIPVNKSVVGEVMEGLVGIAKVAVPVLIHKNSVDAMANLGSSAINALGNTGNTTYTNSNNTTSGDVEGDSSSVSSGDTITSGDVATSGDTTSSGDVDTAGDTTSSGDSFGSGSGNDGDNNGSSDTSNSLTPAGV